jgi:hypothetical protein
VQGGRWGAATTTHPDQYVTILVHGNALGVDELFLEHRQNLVIQAKLELQRAVGNPATLAKELDDLIEDLKEFHPHASKRADAVPDWPGIGGTPYP